MIELLAADGLYKSYGSGAQKVEVLMDLSLRVESGDLVAICGESGSGKSTLLHLLGGMDRPDKGVVHFEDQDIYAWSAEARAGFRNREIGFVFQFHHLLPEFTAEENLLIPLLLQEVPIAKARETACQLLQEVGLEKRRCHRSNELSGGEQQRVALARALVTQPRLLLADEPTGNLDQKNAGAIEKLLLEIHSRWKLTIILVTHSDRLANCCYRRLHLENGKLL